MLGKFKHGFLRLNAESAGTARNIGQQEGSEDCAGLQAVRPSPRMADEEQGRFSFLGFKAPTPRAELVFP